MKYEIALRIGNEVLKQLEPYIVKGELVGSIRRKKPECRDIDILVLPRSDFMIIEKIKGVLSMFGNLSMKGEQILRANGKDDLEIDLYIANPKNYGILRLIRTGSKEHNVKLATLAKKQNKQLKFSEGLIDRETKKLLASTEREIFHNLKMDYIEPEKRD